MNDKFSLSDKDYITYLLAERKYQVSCYIKADEIETDEIETDKIFDIVRMTNDEQIVAYSKSDNSVFIYEKDKDSNKYLLTKIHKFTENIFKILISENGEKIISIPSNQEENNN